jgi:hypothetical protein
MTRLQLADCVRQLGDPAEAVQQRRDVVADATQLADLPSTNVLGIGRCLAKWTGGAGDPAEAVRKSDELVETATRHRGGLRRTDFRPAAPLGRLGWHAGHATGAVREPEQLTTDAATHDELLETVRRLIC